MSLLQNCTTDQKPVGLSSCKKFPEAIVQLILTPSNFSFTEVQIQDPSAWQAAVKANKSARVVVLPRAISLEVASEEAIRASNPLGTQNVFPGRYAFKLMFQNGFNVHKALQSYRGFEGRVFLVDHNKTIVGTKLGENKYAGFDIDLIDPEKLKLNDLSNATTSPVFLSLADPSELDESGVLISGSAILNGLVPLSPAEVTVESATSSAVTVKVVNENDGVAVLGLAAGDFVLLDGNGDAQTISGVTDNEDGTYVLAGTGLVTGTVNLVTPANLSVDAFESTAAATVTIA